MYGEKLFPRPKTGILEGDQLSFAVDSFIADGLKECWNAENVSFVSVTVKYLTKSTDKLICLSNVYFEIYIV